MNIYDLTINQLKSLLL